MTYRAAIRSKKHNGSKWQNKTQSTNKRKSVYQEVKANNSFKGRVPFR